MLLRHPLYVFFFVVPCLCKMYGGVCDVLRYSEVGATANYEFPEELPASALEHKQSGQRQIADRESVISKEDSLR